MYTILHSLPSKLSSSSDVSSTALSFLRLLGVTDFFTLEAAACVVLGLKSTHSIGVGSSEEVVEEVKEDETGSARLGGMGRSPGRVEGCRKALPVVGRLDKLQFHLFAMAFWERPDK